MKQKMSRQERKERRTKMWYGVITILVMVSGGFAIFADSLGGGSKYDYNGFEFENQNQMWTVEINGQQAVFVSHPTEVDYIPITDEIKEVFVKNANTTVEKGIFITSDATFPKIDEVKQYFMSHLYYDFGTLSLNSVTYENELNITVVNCSDATKENPVVLFEHSTSTGFDYRENCVIMMAPNELGLIRLADRILYSLHGVTLN